MLFLEAIVLVTSSRQNELSSSFVIVGDIGCKGKNLASSFQTACYYWRSGKRTIFKDCNSGLLEL